MLWRSYARDASVGRPCPCYSFVQKRQNIDNQTEMRLKTLYELRQEFELLENFILINGEKKCFKFLGLAVVFELAYALLRSGSLVVFWG